MDNPKSKLYKTFKLDDSAVIDNYEHTPGKRPVILISDLSFSPPTDVWETEDRIYIMMEIAGLSLSDIAINYQNGYLFIAGERKEPAILKNAKIRKYHKKEIDFGNFKVKIKVSTRIRKDNITANYKNGILTIFLPKDGASKKIKAHAVNVKEM